MEEVGKEDDGLATNPNRRVQHIAATAHHSVKKLALDVLWMDEIRSHHRSETIGHAGTRHSRVSARC